MHTREEIGLATGVSQRYRKENSAFVSVPILDLKAEFRRRLPTAPRSGLFRGDAMHERRIDPLTLRRVENVQAVLAMGDQLSLIKSDPFAHMSSTIPM